FPPATIWLSFPYQVSSIVSRGIGAFEMFFTVNTVTTMSFSRFGAFLTNSTSAWPLIGGVNFLPARIDVIGGDCVWPDCAETSTAQAMRLPPATVAARMERARVIQNLPGKDELWKENGTALYRYISPFQSSGSGLTDRKISMCHL